MAGQEAGRAYADRGGVDYRKLQRFKDMMRAVGARTRHLPRGKGIKVRPLAHGVYYECAGDCGVGYLETLEGLGNKDWAAEWMYAHDPAGGTRYGNIIQDLLMMGVNDNISHGADPFMVEDEIACGDSDWVTDQVRAGDVAEGVYRVCLDERMALGSGETPAYKYLVRAREPVESAPVMSVHITGIVQGTLVVGDKVRAGDVMLAARATGVHANGVSLCISHGLELEDQFLTRLPSGRYYGDVLLDPTPSYSRLVRSILDAGIRVHAFHPVTGDGVAKLAFSKSNLTYVVEQWLEESQMPEIFPFLRRLPGMTDLDMATTFNLGFGYVLFVARSGVKKAHIAAAEAGFPLVEIGHVTESERGRGTLFRPWGDLWLPAPGD